MREERREGRERQQDEEEQEQEEEEEEEECKDDCKDSTSSFLLPSSFTISQIQLNKESNWEEEGEG
jgi:hypothetical protein